MNAFPAALPDEPSVLEEVIWQHEQSAGPLKKDTQARIVWRNPQRKDKTPCSIVYLHGFKGSQGEGHPVHRTVADELGCNLYLSRLHGHGLRQAENFSRFSSDNLIQSAIDACRIGAKIGENLILMGTSTGASLALYVASLRDKQFPVNALVLYSPLIHLYGINALLLENSVGRTILRFIPGKNYRITSDPFAPEEAIWYSSYRLNGALELGKTVQKLMRPATFARVTCPVFCGYYFKNSNKHDRIVSVPAIKRMMQNLGTPHQKQKLVNFPEAGSHVIACSLLSHAVKDVTRETTFFLMQHTP